jgi:hypothetical protein
MCATPDGAHRRTASLMDCYIVVCMILLVFCPFGSPPSFHVQVHIVLLVIHLMYDTRRVYHIINQLVFRARGVYRKRGASTGNPLLHRWTSNNREKPASWLVDTMCSWMQLVLTDIEVRKTPRRHRMGLFRKGATTAAYAIGVTMQKKMFFRRLGDGVKPRARQQRPHCRIHNNGLATLCLAHALGRPTTYVAVSL